MALSVVGYSGLAPEALMIGSQNAICSSKNFFADAGVDCIGSIASSPILFTTSGSLSARLKTALSLSMIGLGVAAGACATYQVLSENLKPAASSTVGTSGS